MSYTDPTVEWSLEDIDLMLGLLPIMEADDFVASTSSPIRRWVENGERRLDLGHADYHKVFDEYWRLIYETTTWIDAYAPLPEDATPEGIPFSVMGAHFPADYFVTATLNQVRRYFAVCTRGERFCDGYMAGQFEDGAILAALRRLKELRDTVVVPVHGDK
jgi:Family of unknown function (DUF6508)